MSHKKKRSPLEFLPRALLALFFSSTLVFLPSFKEHFLHHFTGLISDSVIRDQWHIVALNVILFIAFLIPLSYRRRVDWKEKGIVVAFFISLFVEMYGVPFTLLFVSRYTGQSASSNLDTVMSIHLLGVDFGFTIPMIYGSIMMLAGMALIIVGWMTLYRNIKGGELVTSGIYSISRNPQYLGFILMVLGWLVGWPTLLTVLFASILLYKYIKLCRQEEEEISGLEGFREYKRSVPLII